MKNIVGAFEVRCLFCSGKRITRKGRRRKKFETIQLWYCRDCDQVFTPRALKGKTYPIPVILDGLGYYNTGYFLETSAKRLKERYGIMVTPTTLSRWLREFKELTTYARLRESGMVLFPPHQVIQSTRLHHRQVYHYRIHRAKLELLLNDRHQKNLAPLSSFLLSMADHALIVYSDRRAAGLTSRCGLTPMEFLSVRNKTSLRGFPNLPCKAYRKTNAAMTVFKNSCFSMTP